MIAVAGIWELGYSAPLTEADLWQYPLRDFDVNYWAMTPVSGVNVRCLDEFPTVDAMLESFAGFDMVFVDEKGETELAEFEHPKNVCYVFGKASYSPMMGRDGASVRIATPKQGGMLWPHQAAAVVLYDRYLKL